MSVRTRSMRRCKTRTTTAPENPLVGGGSSERKTLFAHARAASLRIDLRVTGEYKEERGVRVKARRKGSQVGRGVISKGEGAGEKVGRGRGRGRVGSRGRE